jgi:predicted nucleotidyltransferase
MTPGSNIEHLIEDVEQKLRALFHHKLSRIILYGSYARGDYDDESDIDVIVLIDDDDLKKYHRQILRINVDLSLMYDVDLTIIVENNTNFNLNVDVIPLFKNIYREGIIRYFERSIDDQG